MEVGSRRRLQTAKKGNDSLGFPWIWNSDSLHDCDHIGLCLSRLLVAGQPWRLDDLCHGLVRLPRNSSRIRFGPSLQKFWRRKVEVQCSTHLDLVPRSCVCPLLHHELGSLVRGFLGRYSFLHLGRPFGPLALRQCAPDIRRSILRIPETSYRTSCQDKPDPETNP